MSTSMRRIWALIVLGVALALLVARRRGRTDAAPAALPEWPSLPTRPARAPIATVDPVDPADPADPADAAAAAAAWVAALRGETMPEGFPVKVKVSSGIYHVPGGRFYERTNADRWYATAEAAEADGYRRSKN